MLRRVQVGLRRLNAPAGRELVEGVVVGDRGEHARLAHAQLADQRHVFRGGANPGRRLDRRAAAIALQRAFERGAVRGAIDEELGLADRAGRAGEAAEQVVDEQALLGRERQSALLAVAVGRLGRPDLRPAEPDGRAVQSYRGKSSRGKLARQ